ncbi:hypothetical protein A2U01_0099647, partial [Trifolium medium]|nr:hypothetical protein [Trifolium medium]
MYRGEQDNLEEANQWWKNAKLRVGAGGIVISWEMFKGEFLRKY